MTTVPSDNDIEDVCRRRAAEDPRFATAWALLKVAAALRSFGAPEAATPRAIQSVSAKLGAVADAIRGVGDSIEMNPP